VQAVLAISGGMIKMENAIFSYGDVQPTKRSKLDFFALLRNEK